MGLTELTEVHMRLCDMARYAGVLGPVGTALIEQARSDVSGEAWKIANPASPHLNDPAYTARQDRA